MGTEKQPLFVKIYEDILRKIVSGEYPVGHMLPTELQLARDYNVSRITSKRALEELRQEGYIIRQRGKGSFVAETRPDKIIPSKPNVVAFVIPFSDLIDSAIELISGITSVLNEHNLYLSVLNSHSRPSTERKFLESLAKDGIKGVILYPCSNYVNFDVILHHSMNNFPLVIMDKYYEGLNIYSVVSDNFDGGYKAAMHLYELNHRRIAFVSDLELGMASSVRDRYLGFCKAQSDCHLEIRENNFFFTGHVPNTYIIDSTRGNVTNNSQNIDAWKRVLTRLLDCNNAPTAIHVAYDYLAICLLKTAQAMGLKIPNDLSIIGFDNVAVGAYLDVPLTTISQDFHKIGTVAGETIISLIQGKNPGKKNRIVIPVELVKRQSTCAI